MVFRPALLVLVLSVAACHLVLPLSAADDAQVPLDRWKADGPADASHVESSREGLPDMDGPPGLESGPPPGDGGAVPVWKKIFNGVFTMGSPADEPCRLPDSPGDNEVPHTVTLTHDFEIQSTEVTQGQFQSVMGYNPSNFGPNNPGKSCGPDCPVEMVSWHESAAYCNELSKNAGEATCYTCAGSGASVTCVEAQAYSGQQVYGCPGYRLPTDAEWEYACRAGTTTAYYNGANDLGKCRECTVLDSNAHQIAWYCANSNGTTHPVGRKTANPWGLYDMAGNVWEWCHDRYQESLGSSPATDPWGATAGGTRVLRGGGWHWGYPERLRAALRDSASPAIKDNEIGFRCVRTR